MPIVSDGAREKKKAPRIYIPAPIVNGLSVCSRGRRRSSSSPGRKSLSESDCATRNLFIGRRGHRSLDQSLDGVAREGSRCKNVLLRNGWDNRTDCETRSCWSSGRHRSREVGMIARSVDHPHLDLERLFVKDAHRLDVSEVSPNIEPKNPACSESKDLGGLLGRWAKVRDGRVGISNRYPVVTSVLCGGPPSTSWNDAKPDGRNPDSSRASPEEMTGQETRNISDYNGTEKEKSGRYKRRGPALHTRLASDEDRVFEK
ncbi:UNVERIFIED_CONTAM: hypothetical protein PYX00_003045 [Menopon gallinae]|uniref:Uncharacterized protein n=1 Tax=Menopon gallinae TaxID=328185 RepID=A0AAW2I0P2_9NEOP